MLLQHQQYKGGRKTVCVSAVLAYFGIAPSDYRYSYSERRGKNIWPDHLYRKGYSSRLIKGSGKYKGKTFASFKREVRSIFLDGKHERAALGYAVSVLGKENGKLIGHLMLLGTDGQELVDTAPEFTAAARVMCIRVIRRR